MKEDIFRAYDIRGIYGKDLTEDLTYKIGQAFGTRLLQAKKTHTIIGYDNRSSSISLFEALSKGIMSTGVHVISLGLVTTPMYYFGWHLLQTKSGIMITASHNPKEYNGFKISFNGIHNAFGEDIQAFKNLVFTGPFVIGNGSIREENIKERYINFILEKINLGTRKLKIAVDAGNGAASIVIKDVMDRLKIDYIPLYVDSNPNYPNHHPDPSIIDNLNDLSNTVISHHCDIGFAYDGDADRIGLVDENGKPIYVDQLMIIVIRNILSSLPDKRILYDVKCSKALEDEIIKLGGIPVLSRTGNSYLRAKIANDNILFGGELSGHVFFNDKFPGYDDGIYASLRIIELLSHTNTSISSMLNGISTYINTPELKVAVREDNKFYLIEKTKEYASLKGYSYNTIDGCKILFEDGFVLIRASNTGPYLTTRFEAKTKDRLDAFMLEFNTLIDELKKSSINEVNPK